MSRKSDFIVNTLSDFVGAVDTIVMEWTQVDHLFPWFRGHNNHENQLLPTIYRSLAMRENEDSYRHDFMLKAHPFLDQSYYRPTDNLDWYFLMQHYGLPTRLLDWTEGSLMALHFALNYKRDDDASNPCVWVLNPFELNQHFADVDEIIADDPMLLKYVPKPWSKSKLPPNPVAIQPRINSKRIFSQKGCFLLFGNKVVDLAEMKQSRNFLKKIEIEYFHIERMRDSLMSTGVTESVLFPELSGLAKEIYHYYRNG